jgi:hypothetical protein
MAETRLIFTAEHHDGTERQLFTLDDWAGGVEEGDLETFTTGVWYGVRHTDASIMAVTCVGYVEGKEERIGFSLVKGSWGGPDLVYI